MISPEELQFFTPILPGIGIRLVYLWQPTRRIPFALTVMLEELFKPEMQGVIRFYSRMYGHAPRILQPISAEDVIPKERMVS
jgi:hypothetical protein